MKIYWVQEANGPGNDGKVMRANLDGSLHEELVATADIPDLSGAGAITFAPESVRLYWSDNWLDNIWSANPDGSDIVLIADNVFGQTRGLAVDEGEAKVYWTDASGNRIRRANLDGTEIEDVVVFSEEIVPLGLALDAQNQHMYFARRDDVTNAAGIFRADLDGSGLEELVTEDGRPRGIALDLASGHMYWSVVLHNEGRIRRANLDGTDVETLVENLIGPGGVALALVEGKVYWTGIGVDEQNVSGLIQRANLDGSNVEDIVTDDLSLMYDIAISEAVERPDYRFEYAAKLLCGIQDDPEDRRLAPGFYATIINVHNPHREPVSLFKKLALAYPPGEQRPGQVIPIATDTLGPDEVLAVDCVDIQNRLFPDGLPDSYVEGLVVVQCNQSLDVTAVYTTAAVDADGRVTSHSSIHVEQVRERDTARVTEVSADLEIRKAVDAGRVSSTSLVRYIIYVTNNGPAAAQNVVVTDSLQFQTGTLISVLEGQLSATHGGTWTVGQVTNVSAELEATIPVLPASEQAVLEFVVVIRLDLNELQAFLVNTASVTSDTVDPNPSNNSIVLETLLQP